LKALELFAGIGGFSAAAGHTVNVVAALDASAHVLSVYAHNFSHPIMQTNLEGRGPEALDRYEADLWWMSPPCQPYTVRGKGRDLDDPRARSFLWVLEALPSALPRYLALENVAGFADSRARDALLRTLKESGYLFQERILCPTELGIPNLRPRYYLAASREAELRPFLLKQVGRPLPDYLDSEPDEELFLPTQAVKKYGRGFSIATPEDTQGMATCFTGAYGRSWTLSGSYLKYPDSRVRRFSPEEIARLLHFPESFRFPDGVSRQQRWKYLGNSLNVAAVREVLYGIGLPVLTD